MANQLIIHPWFMKVYDAKGETYARANLTEAGDWSVRLSPGADYISMTADQAMHAITAAATLVSLATLGL